MRPVVFLALPLAVFWVRKHERRILRIGRPLSTSEREDACRVGVADPDRVRVLDLAAIPTPTDGMLGWFARLVRFPLFEPSGMALGHGIYLTDEVDEDRMILVHELVHVYQYEQMGGPRQFLRDYLSQCLTKGYDHAPLEHEANEVAAEICGTA